MAAVDPTRYNELCRLCASKTTMLLGVHIFQNDGIVSQIQKKIESCLPINVHETDELPKMVCENCLYKLNLLSEFRERTVRTEQLLLAIIKEINSDKQQHNQEPLNVVAIEQNELIMVQHPQLLNSHDMSNVNEIGLHQLSNGRDQIIVGHEIILTHQNVDMNGHSLGSLDLNHHELTQDMSNHSLQAQDTILVETSNGHITNTRFTGDNLDLIQHQQLLTDQFRLHHDLNISDNGEVTDITLTTEELNGSVSKINEEIQHHEGSYHIVEDKKHIIDYHNSSNQNDQIDSIKAEDSNSNTSLLIDEQFNKQNDNKELYVIQENNVNGNTVTPVVNTRDWFGCNICGNTYEEESAFEAHYATHFETCDICQGVFMNSEILNAHRKEAHGSTEQTQPPPPPPPPIKVQLVAVPAKEEDNNVESQSDESGGEDELADYYVAEDEENQAKDVPGTGAKRKTWQPKVCTHCGKTYKTNYKLNEHMRKHTGEKPYKCTSCEKEFRSKIGLAQHAAKHTGKYDYACPTCGKGFQCKSYLMVHQRVHSDVKPYPCTTCGRNFKTKQSLLDHTNRHLGVKPYMCEICGRGFITKGLCKAHQKVHTGLDNRKYSCKVCNKMFVSKSYLQTHLRIHTGEKPFKCEVCGKGFLTKVDLRIHTTMHTGEKSYICEMCGKAFARRDALRCHRRSHTGERPYSCDLCGQTFTQFTPMAIHKRLHTGERPYTCESCGKTFVSRSTMMSHAKKHLQ